MTRRPTKAQRRGGKTVPRHPSAAKPADVSARPAAPAPAADWTRYLLPGFVFGILALIYAQPILDGDLFWHLAYAKQIFANLTLRPDATLYAWTPADGATLYVAWLAEVLLYGIWSIADLPGMFALRYAVIGGIVVLFVRHARRRGIADGASLWLGALFIGVTAQTGSLIKPDLLSLLFLHVLLFVLFRFKRRAQDGAANAEIVWILPGLLVVWANCHGAFIYAAPLLAAFWLGEAINRRTAPAHAPSRRAFVNLTLGIAACLPAVMINPYGPAYPWQLFADYVLSATPRPDVAWNNAYRSIFALGWTGLTMAVPVLVAFGALVFAVRTRRRHGDPFDWAVLLINVAALPFFILYLRSMFIWPAVLAYSVVHLSVARGAATEVGRPGWQLAGRRLATLSLAGMMVLGGRAAADAVFRPTAWVGFGIGPINPVVEAEYLARAGFGPRLYNIFDSGGYLLWRLYPRYKVMTDSRSFPYLSWFADQYDFATGKRFDSIVEKYPADVAVIDLAKIEAVHNFLQADAWQLAFYGPTAAIFARKTDAAPRPGTAFAADRFERLPNGPTALRVYDFAQTIGDHKTAWLALDQLEGRLSRQIDADALAVAQALRQAHRALAARRFDDADRLFRFALATKPLAGRHREIAALLGQRAQALKDGAADRVRNADEALARLALPGA